MKPRVPVCYNRHMELLSQRKKPDRIRRSVLLLSLCGLLYLFAQDAFLAEYVFARGIVRAINAVLGFLTNGVPVSFYEWTAVLLILGFFALLVRWICLAAKKKGSRIAGDLYRVWIFLLCVLLSFTVLYAPLYSREGAEDALGISASDPDTEEVYAAAEYYIGRLNALSAEVERDGDGLFVSSLSFSETAERINAAYDGYGSYFAGRYVTPKKVVLSEAMSYLGITGIYFPFYAESNVNTCVPSYTLPVTMAHEIAHAKGVSRENEANICAYAVCIRSGDADLAYSGCMAAASVLLNALPPAERTALKSTLNGEILAEYAAASAHYSRYEGWISDVSTFFNDLFLKANGVSSGTGSYGETAAALTALAAESA